ncbi:MAG: hypothetical protein ACOYUK_05440 [Patescibacteria group bacterium]
MTYEIGYVMVMGGAAPLGFLLDLVHRKNIVDRRDAILSWIWFTAYFVITSVMLISRWTQQWPYFLVVTGYGVVGLTIYYIQKNMCRMLTMTQNTQTAH